MARTRRLRQRPLKVQMSTVQKMSMALENIRRRKMIRQLVIDESRKYGIEVNDREGEDAAK
ncbi:hypothetical protein [Ruegeria atlantica]|uniref:hypothetical protein n=1 Tax=Ruegeria atlantica TaxID=81569 RepID=UPI00147B7A28|nr:hypothetical protein [Ruegeria atlantica]